MLAQICQKIYQKPVKECTKEELYLALLEMTKKLAKEKEFTKTILECAAIIAYKQPITKPELEDIRQVSCDYAIHTLLELEMIVACGRKDAVGKPIM